MIDPSRHLSTLTQTKLGYSVTIRSTKPKRKIFRQLKEKSNRKDNFKDDGRVTGGGRWAPSKEGQLDV